MRTIKFRGKNLSNGEWVFGDLLHSKGHVDIATDEHLYEVKSETVGQYTDLKDRTGKEIYEGDIISFFIIYDDNRFKKYKGVVKYCDCVFQVWHSNDNNKFYDDDDNIIYFNLGYVRPQDHQFEVIGNIYDNPEFLEEQENERN